MSFSAVSLLGARMSALANPGDNAVLLDPQGYVVATDTGSTAWGVLLSAAALGQVGTPQRFLAKQATQSTQLALQVIVRVPWTLTTQAAGAASGVIDAVLLLNGVAVSPVVSGNVRNLNSANGTQFVELLTLVMSSPAILQPGDVLAVQLTPRVTIASIAGQTFTPTLRHDPQVINDQLVAEFQGLEGVI